MINSIDNSNMKSTTHQDYQSEQYAFSAVEIASQHESLYGDHELSTYNNTKYENQDPQNQDKKGNSSSITVAFNLINTTIGDGILGYPYIIRQMGIIAGILTILIAGILTCFSVSILLKIKNLCEKSDYIDIADTCFKKFGRILAEVIIILNTLGGCIIYLVVYTIVVQNILETFVDTCAPNRDQAVFYCRPSLITIFGALLILPFNFMKDFGKLKVLSLLKMLSILMFTGITIGFAIFRLKTGEIASDIEMFPNFGEPVDMLASIPQIIFGFNFLYNQFSLYSSMREPQDSKFTKIAFSCVAFVALVYIAVGTCGYLIYGSSTDNMLKNLKKEDLGSVWFGALNAAFLVCSLTGIPVTFFPAREIFYESIMRRLVLRKSYDSYTRIADDQRNLSPPTQKNRKVFVSVVLITNILIVLIAIVAPNLNQVLGLFGSIGSSGLMFLFPMAFYLFLTSGKQINKILPIIVIIFGIVVALSGYTTNLMKMVSS